MPVIPDIAGNAMTDNVIRKRKVQVRIKMDDKDKLSNPQVTIQTIKKYDFRFQKRFGQNFLIDDHVIRKILAAADISKEDIVVEIGPGIGTLTQYLAEAAGQVYAVEIDENLLPVLADTLSAYDNVTVVNQDILKSDIRKLIGEGNSCKIVANLPYYITTPIIMGLLEGGVPAESITVMVQKEVAERMAAGPGSKIYGALSLAVQFYAETYLAANVPPNCFMPRPAVGSAVIRLTRRNEPAVTVKDEKFMFRLIRASFNERRKTLVNSLRNEPALGLSREQVEEALGKMGLSLTVRGETLSLEQFAGLSDLLHE
jgi:16S rRNA (adenine1518-N6/adenine1519-N6)-dimethyltransferase